MRKSSYFAKVRISLIRIKNPLQKSHHKYSDIVSLDKECLKYDKISWTKTNKTPCVVNIDLNLYSKRNIFAKTTPKISYTTKINKHIVCEFYFY